MSVSVSAFPTIFVPGSIPQPIPQTRHENWELAYQLTSDLAKRPDPVVLNAFMEKNPEFYLNSQGRFPWTAMAVAIDKQALPLIRAILDRDPSIANAQESYLLDAFSPKMVQIFLEHGADINQHRNVGRLGNGITPLYTAIEARDDNYIKFLLLRGGIVYAEAWQRIKASGKEYDIEKDPAYVQQIIQQIQKEYLDSTRSLTHKIHSTRTASALSNLPKEISGLITQFLNHEASLRGRFLAKLNLVRE